MKNLYVLLFILVSGTALSAEIRDGRYSAETRSIEFDVNYGGGCKKHSFRLEIGGCLESMPVQCMDAKLIDDTHDDYCEAFIYETVRMTLKSTGLDDSYYRGAFLQVHGSGGTKVNIRLP